jgi:hypothetical protein
MADKVAKWRRLLVAAVIATIAMSLPLRAPRTDPGRITDLGQAWFSASAILHHADPYKLIGPTGIYHHEYPLLYPLTAAIAILPLGLLSETTAAAVFVWISTALLVYAITARGWHRLPVLLSLPFLTAAYQAQWSPILAAGFCLPALAWIFAAKPSIGLALLAATDSIRTLKIAVLGGLALGLIALGFVPQWPAEWLKNIRGIDYMVVPVLRTWGFIVLLALLRWRRPEARLIVALACVPQTITWYDMVVLLLVASTFRESLFVALMATSPMIYEMLFGLGDGTLDLYPRSNLVLMVAVYVPAIVIVLRRPNEGEFPAWLQLIRRAGQRRARPMGTG